MPDAAAATLQHNRRWLSQVAPSLAVHLDDQSVDAIEFRQRSPEADSVDFDLFFGDERVLEACHQSLNSLLDQQLKRTDGVAMPRPTRSLPDSKDVGSAAILAEMVNQHQEVLIDHLPSIPSPGALSNVEKPPYRNLVIFGSLMLVPLLPYLQGLARSPGSASPSLRMIPNNWQPASRWWICRSSWNSANSRASALLSTWMTARLICKIAFIPRSAAEIPPCFMAGRPYVAPYARRH